ncbi:GGDEF domain-containing protein [Rugamonas fusca]|uniref:GGDEF domain-containing protein n=1 Tax=Rugamonas fusca TaxID=2758568 RepID=UPI001C7148B5|nr:GGDEF domain-containing protein [Rugamonas fusca]
MRKDKRVSHRTEPLSDSERLQGLLTMARELLQIDEPSAVLRLAGRAIVELSGATEALLLIGGESPLGVAFGCDGTASSAHVQHPWYAAAHARMTGGPSVPAPTGTLMVAVPQAQPIAVLLAACPVGSTPEIARRQAATLETALELTAATLGRIQVRSSLEQLVTTQYTQLAERTQEHADELARRDLAARDMLSLSLTDVLTGLNNRRGFFVRTEPLFRLAQRQHRGSALVYVDIDALKVVNDTLGHAVGDQMIRDAAAVLRASLRDADVLARMGGDEFVAYALDEAQPHALLSRLQQALDAFNRLRQRPYLLSLSAGMVSCDPAASTTLSDYIQQADDAMYEHKRRRLH